MALSWSTESITALTTITTEQYTGDISILPNERCTVSLSLGTHTTDDFTVTVYGRLASTGNYYTMKSFTIPAEGADVEYEAFDLLGGPEHVRVGVKRAAGSTDSPTATFLGRKSVVNGA